MNRKQLNEALKNYLKGTASEEDRAVIDQWYEQYSHLPGFTESLSSEEKQVLRRRMLQNIRNKIGAGTHETEMVADNKVLPMRRKWLALTAVAATVTLLLMTALLWQKAGNSTRFSNKIANSTRSIIRQVLPDSSVVWLNPGATISYPAAFDKEARRITMSGDCFFEVTKNPYRPFIIESSRLITKVWGTSFRVWDKPEAAMAKVTVVTGKVSVSKKAESGASVVAAINKNEIILLPKQEVVYSKATQELQASQTADMKPVQKWEHTGMLVEDEPFADIVNSLEQKFGVSITLAGTGLDKARMTADLSDLNLAEVLEVLKVSMHINYAIEEDHVIISR